MEPTDRGRAFMIHEADEDPKKRMAQINAIIEMDSIHRFSAAPEMIHQNSDMDHTFRVGLSTLFLRSYLRNDHGIEMDSAKVTRMAQYHDYPEMITGDIPTPVKSAMNEAEKAALKAKERAAIIQIAERIAPNFVDLFVEDFDELSEKKSNEAQVVDIADKVDALCEVITDIRCGNDTPEVNDIYTNYIKIIKNLDRHPLMSLLKQYPTWGFANIPTLEEVQNLPKIDLNLLSEGKEVFWDRVFDEHLPNIYKFWLSLTTNKNSVHLGILPAYQEVLRDNQMTQEMRDAVRSGLRPSGKPL